MSETAKFHPEIEKALETDGIDIGRVKDVDLAHYVGNSVNWIPDENEITARHYRNGYNNELVRHEIAKRAVIEKFNQDDAEDLVNDGLRKFGDMGDIYAENRTVDVRDYQKEAEIVGEEYDTLQRIAKRAHHNRETQS